MDDKKMLEGLKEARELIAERIPAIIAWTAVKALDEAIKKMAEEKAEVA